MKFVSIQKENKKTRSVVGFFFFTKNTMVQENIIFAMKPSETLPGTGRSDIWLIYSRLVIFCSPDDVCLLAPLLSIQVLSRSTTCLIARERGEKSNKISLSVILV